MSAASLELYSMMSKLTIRNMLMEHLNSLTVQIEERFQERGVEITSLKATIRSTKPWESPTTDSRYSFCYTLRANGHKLTFVYVYSFCNGTLSKDFKISCHIDDLRASISSLEEMLNILCHV